MTAISLTKVLALGLHRVTSNTSLTARQILTSNFAKDCTDIKDLSEKLATSSWNESGMNFNALKAAYDALEMHLEQGIDVISCVDTYFPNYLKQIPNSPNLIFIRGNKDLLLEPAGAAVVGAREVSSVGSEITRRITKVLVSNNFTIVSGLAIGVDAAAHRAALQAKGKTIAVLANGLEKAQPKQNALLGQEILDNDGAWVSEYEIGVRPFKTYFVHRNRIQVGLSAGSVIIEAKEKSGSMTQAEFCVKSQRPLFAVQPHQPNNPLNLVCDGTNIMVEKLGAYPLKTKQDYAILIEQLLMSRESMSFRENELF
ncbi:DNA-protecting protein DprA [Vibrio parahaemolyticus]|uniref:DNA-processing protein DprA n=1 Tax=Vibrio parahaemolyticus TaxID=670 RepID=UPI00064B4888|nr:DNA-processing protein DprA [Vibrio parahaemolyticus]EJG1474824.1 DNA-protecting protein DprA [Vibrio parahaemolyticus]EKG9660426.1 DNA-protecting protein DprA [Vibrio parahaemolyticus]OXD41312.1 DNA processing protein DprA [Vibrio parahaemolyticus]OYR33511.1 DNA processing protein DprA [Vibrio parahaemolyticus]